MSFINNVKHRIDHKEGLESVIEFVNKNMDCFGEVNTETEGVCKIPGGREINKNRNYIKMKINNLIYTSRWELYFFKKINIL